MSDNLAEYIGHCIETKTQPVLHTDDLKAIKRSLEAWDNVRDDIGAYRADCELADDYENDSDCRQCTANVFGSIERIIDKHLKEVEK